MFGETLFSGSPFIRWTLVPVLLLFALGMPLMVDQWTPGVMIGIGTLSATSLLLALGLTAPSRFGWANRVVAAIVFLAFVLYLGSEIVSGPWRSGSRSQPSILSALAGLVIIGFPALRYALLGRFGPEPSSEENGEPPDGAT